MCKVDFIHLAWTALNTQNVAGEQVNLKQEKNKGEQLYQSI